MKVFLCGDVMTGRGIDQILKHSVPAQIYEDYVKDARDYVKLAENANGPIPRLVSDDYIWGEAIRIWQEKSPDIKIINLETAITISESPMKGKGINYRMHPENVSVLKSADIDACTLANNHVLDWGESGLSETLSYLRSAKIGFAGAGVNSSEAQTPAIFESSAGRLLVYSICFETSGVPSSWEAQEDKPGVWLFNSLTLDNAQKFRESIERHRKDGDLTVASIHWGSNWGYEISHAQMQFAHSLIDTAGVDIIHGHSSHHPRPIEVYKGRPILYGCGDFINDYEGIRGYDEYRSDLALMYFMEFDLQPFKLLSFEMSCLQRRKFRLELPKPADVTWLFETLSKVSSPFLTKMEMTGIYSFKVL